MRGLLGVWLLCHGLLALAQSDPFPATGAAYQVEVNGEVLWARQSQRQLAPASLTKLMTALLVADEDQPLAVATVSAAAARETGSRLGLKAGQKFTVQDLLGAALMASANDACRALADHFAGNEPLFVQRMNRRAAQLGMLHTRFVNACGHDAPGHYSTAHDLALLAHAVIKRPLLTDLTAKTGTSIVTIDGTSRYEFKNSNALIGRYRGALGLKTGSTRQAGKCLVAYARRGATQVLLVLLRGSNRWWDAADILDLAFAHAPDPV